MAIKVLMLGPDRRVHGGISGVVNNLYDAGIDKSVSVRYLATMKEGSKLRKALVACVAYLKFVACVSDYDVIHVNMASDFSYLRKVWFIRKAYKKGKKIVLHQHGGDLENYYNSLSDSAKCAMSRVFNMADVILVLSAKSKALIEKIANCGKHGVEKKDDFEKKSMEYYIVPNSVPIPSDEVVTTKEYGVHRLLFLGRICEDKGINELVTACNRLKDEYPDLKLSMGGIFEDGNLKKLVEKNSDYIDYLGWVTGEEKENVLRSCDILVLPSYYEGMPVCVLDALAFGLGVVSTEVGGVPEIIDDGIEGILVKPRDVDSLYNGLKRALENPEGLKTMAQKGREKVKDKYSAETEVDQLTKIYEKICLQ